MSESMPPKGSPELYAQAVEIHKKAFKKEQWNREKYQKSTGHILQSIFGKAVWTLKDLDDTGLNHVIKWAEHKLDKTKPRPEPFIQ